MRRLIKMLICGAMLILVGGEFLFAQQPTYIPPSPQAATFLKYRDYPVDLSTGLVDISVPLMNLKLKSYEFPITAKFHASGQKVDLSYSELGNNWKLAAYGMITREIRGVSDEYFDFDLLLDTYKQDYYELQYSDTDISTREQKWRRRSTLDGSNDMPIRDAERDIYTVSFNSLSSTFIFTESGEAQFLDYFPYKIVKGGNNSFILKDDKGIEYTFGQVVENGTTYGAIINSNNSQQVGTLYWYVGKVITPEKDFLRFKYNVVSSDGFYLGGNALYGATARLGDYAIRYGFNGVDYASKHSGALQFNIQNTYSNEQQKVACLTDIESSIGKVSFSYNAGRYSLNEMVLANNQGIQLQKINFIYQNIAASNLLIPNNQGQTVKEVRIVNPSNSQVSQIYKMEYYPGEITAQSISDYCYGRDYWGYANTNRNYNIIPVDQVVQRVGIGGTGNTGGAPGNNTLTVGSSARRAPDFFSKMIGQLKKITYPTGGHAEFSYEANRYQGWSFGNVSSEIGPGLRISEIKQSDGINAITKRYKYGINEDGMGSLLRKPVSSDFQITQFVTDIPATNGVLTNDAGYVLENAFRFRYREFYSDPVGYIRPAYNIPVYYSNVTEYQVDEFGNNLGKTQYSFQTPYFEVNTKEFNDSGTGDSFIVSKFVPHYYSKSLLNNVSVYEFSNNVYRLKRNTFYSYGKKKEKKFSQATYFRRHKVLSERSNGGENYEEQFVETKYPNSSYNNPAILFPWGVIGTRYYELTAALITQNNVSEFEYTATDTITRSTNNFYESAYTNSPSMIKVSDSRGGEEMKKIYYPDDISSISSLVGGNISSSELQGIEAMKKSSGHFPSIPIQVQSYSNGNVLTEIERSNFKLISGIPMLYKRQKQSNTAGNLLVDYEIMQYDVYSNPVELKFREGLITSYVWGYGGQYPIAEIKNATYTEVATVLTQAAIDNLNSNQTEASMEILIKNVSDKLRSDSRLAKAMVTTYTYKPLVGMTSKTDPRGITEYYKYDGMQRLQAILDHLNYVNKSFDYHYRPN